MKKRQFKKNSELTVKNIKLWKKELDIIGEPIFGDGFSKSITDKEWFSAYLGCTPRYAISEEISYSQ